MIWTFIEDLRHAARGLHRDPFLTIAAGITLAICIGANTTVFSVANSILIRPLPYPGSERIDWITERSGPGHQDVGAAPDYYRIRDWNGVFKDVAAFNGMTLNWTGTDRPEQLDAATVSASFFRVMGTPPMMGRFLAPQEEGGKAPAVAVISYAFWRNHWGGNAEVLGKTIGLNRKPYTIIGVMPQGFDFPRGSQLWIPLDLDESSARIISPALPIRVVSMVARRKADVNPRQLASEMSRLSFVIRAEYPQEFRQRGFRNDLVIGAVPLQEQLTGQLRPAVLVLTGAVSLVLLIACVNVANLLLARAGGRQRELAIRLALGSSRARTIRQMLAESLVLALPGGIAGIGIAAAAVRLLDATKPAMLVNYPVISMDFRVMAFTVALTLATSILFGIVPALSAAGTDVQAVLKAASATHTAGRRATRLRQLLVVGELAVSLVLLIGAGLLARSFLNLAHTELGFRSDQLLTFRVNPIGPFDRVYGPFYAAVLERLQQIPFVRSAALLGDIPLSDEDFYGSGRIRVIGRPAAPFRERPIVNNTMVSADFFRTLEIPLKRGRVFDAHDSVASAETVSFGFVHAEPVVVNEALVRRIFPGEEPIGKQLGFGPDERNITWTIIGTVGDVRGGALGADAPAMVYRCTCAGSPVFRAAFALRTSGDPKAAIRAAEEQVRKVDRDQPISDVKTMDQRRDAALAPERFQLLLIGTFAGIATLLAAAGVYGTMSYVVSLRTREIGIRMAMGARPADVMRSILTQGVVLVAVAVPIGLAGAAAATRYLRSMLFGVTRLDSVTFALTPAVLAAIVMIASVAPARRALRIDPITALREE